MKKIIIQHPNTRTDMEVFIGKVSGENRHIISIPGESYSIESDLNGNINWGYSSLFGHEDFRSELVDQIKRHI